MTESTDGVVRDWLATYDTPDADVAWLVCDRHPESQVAFTFISHELEARDLTFGELADRSKRLAAGLASRGVKQGDRVPVLMGKRPELLVSLIALLRLGAVHVPLFTAFATGAVRTRVEGSGAWLAITEPSQRVNDRAW